MLQHQVLSNRCEKHVVETVNVFDGGDFPADVTGFCSKSQSAMAQAVCDNDLGDSVEHLRMPEHAPHKKRPACATIASHA